MNNELFILSFSYLQTGVGVVALVVKVVVVVVVETTTKQRDSFFTITYLYGRQAVDTYC